LPAAIWGEKEDTYTNSERRDCKVNAIVAPPGESRTDFDIFLEIVARLGVRDELYPSWQTSHDAFLEWQPVSKVRMYGYSPFTWQQIEEQGGAQWGGERLYEDGIFPNSDGRARLHCVPCEPFTEQPNDEFPLILNTGRTVEHWHTRTKTAQVDLLNTVVTHAWLEMNPVDAERLQLTVYYKVTVTSRRSRVPNLELRITGIVAPGQIFMPFPLSEHNFTYLPSFYYSRFHVTKVQAGSLTVLATLTGSLTRAVGGWLSDKSGGRWTLDIAFVITLVGLVRPDAVPVAGWEPPCSLCFALRLVEPAMEQPSDSSHYFGPQPRPLLAA
jgi:anaerobic selenocysteine-containing dehydrogenase